jgi:hypothetical protein
MSRRGNSSDNALPGTTHAESFWSRFKAKLLDGGSLPGLTADNFGSGHYYTSFLRRAAPFCP